MVILRFSVTNSPAVWSDFAVGAHTQSLQPAEHSDRNNNDDDHDDAGDESDVDVSISCTGDVLGDNSSTRHGGHGEKNAAKCVY